MIRKIQLTTHRLFSWGSAYFHSLLQLPARVLIAARARDLWNTQETCVDSDDFVMDDGSIVFAYPEFPWNSEDNEHDWRTYNAILRLQLDTYYVQPNIE